jgi:ADP-heptose:LPS heptosyltransferase
VIIHPKSKGSAREWGLENFGNLLKKLFQSTQYQVFLSGTEEEGKQIRSWAMDFPELIDLTGKMDLSQFIGFIQSCDVLVAASTGPLHIASALGKRAIGLFAPMRPIHPGRWAPIGSNSRALVIKKDCSDCRKTSDCHCIRSIQIDSVLNAMI